ncbi:hypothetical protein NN3_00080 [Nocardia neocaledoniensis NBRC 108232]|nr:hypothetical protein NN3_00080 [Nocardia neocaledoniensis NBRC 108232]
MPFMSELQQRLTQFAPAESAGTASGRPRSIILDPLTTEERRAVASNPYLAHLREGSIGVPPGKEAIAHRLSESRALNRELRGLARWYNDAFDLMREQQSLRVRNGIDPYRLAAELQQRHSSINPWGDDCSSRMLMNWSLERSGLPPSAPPDFSRAIVSTTGQWADAVRTGSEAFGERATRLSQLEFPADPIEVFGMQREYETYRARGLETDFAHGVNFDIEACRDLMKLLREG